MHYIFTALRPGISVRVLVENACSYVEPLEAVDISAVGTGPRSSVGQPVTSIFATDCDIHAFTHARYVRVYVYAQYGTYPYAVPTCMYATAYMPCKLRSSSPIAPSMAMELSRRHGIARN